MKVFFEIGLFVALALALVEAQDSCSTLGCNAAYDGSRSCQCNNLCAHYENCCSDYYTEDCNTCQGYGGCLDYDNRYLCQCNSECSDYGNCCTDYSSECGSGGGSSCTGRCGASHDSSKSCQCNDACVNYGDCCSDYDTVCSGSGSPASFDMSSFASKMWELDVNRIDSSHYTCNMQTQKSSSGSPYTDSALNPLFGNFDESYIYNHGTFATYTKLCDIVEPVQGINEDISSTDLDKVNAYLDDIMATALMQEAVVQLTEAGHVTGVDDFRAKMENAFFRLYSRSSSTDSSGFEHCFCGEFKSSSQVNGFHNWITFYEQEKQRRLNYYGNFGMSQPENLGVQFEWDGRIKSLTSIMLGVSTEFELAIYMACFFEKPDGVSSFTITDGSSSWPVQVQIWTHSGGTKIGSAYFIA